MKTQFPEISIKRGSLSFGEKMSHYSHLENPKIGKKATLRKRFTCFKEMDSTTFSCEIVQYLTLFIVRNILLMYSLGLHC